MTTRAEALEALDRLHASTPQRLGEIESAAATLRQYIESTPTLSADARDAARYRWLRDESDCLSYTSDSGPQPSTPESRMMYAINSAGKRTLDMIEIRLLCHHLGPYDEPIWRDGEHFDYSANMDAAIDAAMAQARADNKEKT